jgi:hypothetical protein
MLAHGSRVRMIPAVLDLSPFRPFSGLGAAPLRRELELRVSILGQ